MPTTGHSAVLSLVGAAASSRAWKVEQVSASSVSTPRRPSWPILTLGLTVLVGLALRIAGAMGGLWLDEAWSAIAAHDVGTPAGVFLGINHDNNHHLNSLWLQLVGWDAPSPVQRALSIATGTLAILVAARLAARAGRLASLVTAALFATSPILVTLGSEARGYAPMVLALLMSIEVVDQALRGERTPSRTRLALCIVLGTLSQLTMIMGLAALGGWALTVWWQREGLRSALHRTALLFAPACMALAATMLLLAGAAWISPRGFQFGSYEAFTWLAWLRAVIELVGYTLGYPFLSVSLVLGALALLVFAPRIGATRSPLYCLAAVAFPVSMALLHTANPGHARYYLLAGVALLLLVGEAIGTALARPGRARSVGTAAMVILLAGAVVQDVRLAMNRRADPFAAVDALKARAPAGAAVWFDRPTGQDTLRVAAIQRHYPLVASTGCPRFALVDRFGGEPMPKAVIRCAKLYSPIASRRVVGLSGTHWTLYERPL